MDKFKLNDQYANIYNEITTNKTSKYCEIQYGKQIINNYGIRLFVKILLHDKIQELYKKIIDNTILDEEGMNKAQNYQELYNNLLFNKSFMEKKHGKKKNSLDFNSNELYSCFGFNIVFFDNSLELALMENFELEEFNMINNTFTISQKLEMLHKLFVVEMGIKIEPWIFLCNITIGQEINLISSMTASHYSKELLNWHELAIMTNGKKCGDALLRELNKVASQNIDMNDNEQLCLTDKGISIVNCEQDEYIAVSWVWSDFKPTLIDIEKMAIEMTKYTGYNKIWFDPISVSCDTGKRTKDIINMHITYTNAIVTVIRFGNKDTELLLAMESYTGMHSYWHIKYTRWYNRIWTYQEASLPKLVTYIYNGKYYRLPRKGDDYVENLPIASLLNERIKAKTKSITDIRLATIKRRATFKQDYIIGVSALTDEVIVTDRNKEGYYIEIKSKTIPYKIILAESEWYDAKYVCWLPRNRIVSCLSTINNRIPIDDEQCITLKNITIIPRKYYQAKVPGKLKYEQEWIPIIGKSHGIIPHTVEKKTKYLHGIAVIKRNDNIWHSLGFVIATLPDLNPPLEGIKHMRLGKLR